MAIVLTRVDGRLIHGQVAVAWTRNVGAEKIIVIDDETANDEMQRTLVELAAPSGVKVEIHDLDGGVEALENGAADGQKTMLIVKRVDTALQLVERGIPIQQINIGGMYHEEGKKQYDKALFVDDEDLKSFEALKDRGVELFYQVAPMNKKQDLFSVLN